MRYFQKVMLLRGLQTNLSNQLTLSIPLIIALPFNKKLLSF